MKQPLDPFLKVVQLANELWQERKNLDYTHRPNASIKKLEEIVNHIKMIEFEKEFEMLKDLYKKIK